MCQSQIVGIDSQIKTVLWVKIALLNVAEYVTETLLQRLCADISKCSIAVLCGCMNLAVMVKRIVSDIYLI